MATNVPLSGVMFPGSDKGVSPEELLAVSSSDAADQQTALQIAQSTKRMLAPVLTNILRMYNGGGSGDTEVESAAKVRRGGCYAHSAVMRRS